MGRLFSVIIPAYNAEAFIAEALDSVARQTLTDFEVVVVDDGSCDGTSKQVEGWAANHRGTELHFIQQDHSGIGPARNAGVRESTGTYVAFLDSDDIWMERKLERMATYFRDHGDTDLLCHDEWMDENAHRRLLRYGPHRSYEQLLFKGNCLSTSAIVVRRKTLVELGGFSEDLRFNGVEDYEMWLRIARSGATIEYLHEVLGIYRIHGQGITSRIDEHCCHYINVVEAHFEQIGTVNIFTRILLRKRRAQILRGAGRAYLKQENVHSARRFLRQAIVQWPFSWKTAVLSFLALARVTV